MNTQISSHRDYPSSFNRRRYSNIGIRAHDHALLQFEVPIAPERVILNELDASEREYLTLFKPNNHLNYSHSRPWVFRTKRQRSKNRTQ